MLRFLTHALILSSFLVLGFVFVACTPKDARVFKRKCAPERDLNALRATRVTESPLMGLIPLQTEKSIVFRTKMDFSNKHFSGLLVLKPAGKDCRIALITELGMKIFDVEFVGGKFIKHFALEGLDKKIILGTIRRDLQLLLQIPDLVSPKKSFLHVSEPQRLVKGRGNKATAWYWVSSENGEVSRVENNAILPNQIRIELSEYEDNFPRKIELTHYKIKLNFYLNFIEK